MGRFTSCGEDSCHVERLTVYLSIDHGYFGAESKTKTDSRPKSEKCRITSRIPTACKRHEQTQQSSCRRTNIRLEVDTSKPVRINKLARVEDIECGRVHSSEVVRRSLSRTEVNIHLGLRADLPPKNHRSRQGY